ncbi:hypothetical protein [Glutamicibacter nicotianae]|uniref:hypothetical protein n=1 Tax=Glutamicibacter nicotianae TaxID=37929 RepID=UPI002552FD9C|nr:hypothetical protein [Glutamicibacter nicotianae]WIV43485.1 hypothetical protein QQS42_14400 [Glutamicibacter nicotianae]
MTSAAGWPEHPSGSAPTAHVSCTSTGQFPTALHEHPAFANGKSVQWLGVETLRADCGGVATRMLPRVGAVPYRSHPQHGGWQHRAIDSPAGRSRAIPNRD